MEKILFESALVVLDIDPRNGGYESLKQLKSIPKTITVKTGGDGLHFYFTYPETKIPNRVNWLPGINIRSDGGYVIAPPSKHKSGGKYSWICTDEISDFPEEWIPSIVKKHQTKLKSSRQAILEGERNNFLTSLAGFLSSKGFNSGISLENALQTFNNHHCTPPLETTEVKKISFSISKYSNLWIEPNTFPDIAPKAPTMDESYLPESLKPWISDVVERMQVPIEFISIPAIISLSAAIGRSISIFPKKYDNWQVTPNLWGALVARPGFFKSPCIAEATKPLQHLANIEKQNFEMQADTLGLEAQFVQAQIDGIMEVIRQRAKADKNDDISSVWSETKFLPLQLSFFYRG